MNKQEKLLKQILRNQKEIMIWISSMKREHTTKPFYDGFFKYPIEETEELIE